MPQSSFFNVMHYPIDLATNTHQTDLAPLAMVHLQVRDGSTFTVQDARFKECAPGLVNFVPAVACHFCLALLAAFTQPGARILADPWR